MKTRLLIEAKKGLKLYKRGSTYKVYHVGTDFYSSDFTLEEAQRYYRIWVVRNAKKIFGYKPKKTLR